MPTVLRPSALPALLAGLALVACGPGEPGPTEFDPGTATVAPLTMNFVSGGGSFTNTINPSNAGRASGAFWDNFSADPGVGTSGLTIISNKCNIGWYAVGEARGVNQCYYASIVSGTEWFPSNSPYDGGTYYGAGDGSRGPAHFMFAAGTYTIRIKASIRDPRPEYISTVGVFTNNGSYDFSRTVGTMPGDEITFEVSQPWGLFIRNNFMNDDGPTSAGKTPETGHCASSPPSYTACSDATGGFGTDKAQHFALFRSADGSRFLVGMEDSRVNQTDCPSTICGGPIGSTGLLDSDYNDYMVEVVPSIPAPALGRFTGGGVWFNSSYGKVTMGFTLHCDNDGLTNNLQVVWGDKKWHLEKNSLDPLLCKNLSNPRPPRAPVNRITATAVGRYFDGSRWRDEDVLADFVLEDNGEPGSSDKVAITIYGAGGPSTTYLRAGQTGDIAGASGASLVTIRGGNIQAHYDQPHGQKP